MSSPTARAAPEGPSSAISSMYPAKLIPSGRASSLSSPSSERSSPAKSLVAMGIVPKALTIVMGGTPNFIRREMSAILCLMDDLDTPKGMESHQSQYSSQVLCLTFHKDFDQ